MPTLFIRNIHCGSCEQDITEVVHAQDAEAKVEFRPGRVLIDAPHFDTARAERTLSSRGFEVQNADVPAGIGGDALNSSADAASRASDAPNDADAPKRAPFAPAPAHLSICSECSNAVRAVFAVSGMTCASCAGSVAAAVRAAVPSVLDVSVDALQGAAFVLLKRRSDADAAKTAIMDAGFDAELVEALPLSEEGVKEYRLRMSIEGMTCASCSSGVRRGLLALPFVRSAEVDAVDGRGEVLVARAGADEAARIREAVEELGYGCELADGGAFEAVHSAQSQHRARTVELRVEGIYCERCPERIMRVLRNYGAAVDVVDAIHSAGRPFVKFTYLPRPPSLSIRSILAELRESNPELTFELVRSKTLEELAAANQRREMRRIRLRLVLASVLAAPAAVLMLSPRWMMAPAAQRAMAVLATLAYFLAADMFHRKALVELRQVWLSRRPLGYRLLHFGSMNLLMSLGTSISYFASVASLLAGSGEVYFDSVLFLTFFLLVGRFLDIYSKIKTTSAVSLVSHVRPEEVLLASSGETVSVDLCEVGDTVLVLPGQRCAVDGLVVHHEGGGDDTANEGGESSNNNENRASTQEEASRGGSELWSFDESMLTGESLPVTKHAGDRVFAGTLNVGRQAARIKATAVGSGTLLNDIVEAVRHGQMQRAPIEKYVEQFTAVFVPLVVYLALAVFAVWYLVSGRLLWSAQFAIATFVVACPCGIGLAAPTALYIGTGLAAKYGVLARGGGEAFQEAAHLNVMCFDKTGTLTVGGDMRISDTWGAESDEVVQLASKLEQDSVHPLAAAVVEYAQGRKITAARCGDVVQVSEGGRGVQARVTAGQFAGETAVLGNEQLVASYGGSNGSSSGSSTLSREQQRLLAQWKGEGKSVILLAISNHGVVLMLAAADQIRPESRQVVFGLERSGVTCYMISGDNADTARAVASQVGINADRVIAGVLPQQKSDKIKELQQTAGASALAGRTSYGRAVVGMIGDGVNDAPALAQSDVGIAQGRGADIALSSSQFVLLREDLGGLPILISISRAVISKVKANFFWAAIYNCVAIPVAAGVLYPWTHRRLDPVWASLAMALSSVSVMVNSFCLRRYRP